MYLLLTSDLGTLNAFDATLLQPKSPYSNQSLLITSNSLLITTNVPLYNHTSPNNNHKMWGGPLITTASSSNKQGVLMTTTGPLLTTKSGHESGPKAPTLTRGGAIFLGDYCPDTTSKI